MLSYVVRRIALSVVALFFLVTLMFILVRAVPGDPAVFAAGVTATADQVEQVRRELGLDQPCWVQYVAYLKRLFLQGDLGMSIVTNRPVLEDLRLRLPASLELALLACVIGLCVGLPLGSVAALRWGTGWDQMARAVGVLGVAMPTFWFAMLLQLVFYRLLGWFPVAGRLSIAHMGRATITGLTILDALITHDFGLLGDYLWHMFLPAVALSQTFVALGARLFRASLLEVLSADYIRTARGKGLRETLVVGRHAARNALIPIVSLSGVYFGLTVGNAILTETIFNWPGIGTYLVRAIASFDYPGILGGTLVLAAVFMAANLVADLLNALLDPRLRPN